MIQKFIQQLKTGLEPYPRIRGNCAMCGKCCQSLILTRRGKPVSSMKDFRKLLRWDRFTYERFVPDSNQTEGEPLRFSCIHQAADKSCSVHNDRPMLCQTYPHHSIFKMGAELEDGCGYRLVQKGSFEDVLESVQQS